MMSDTPITEREQHWLDHIRAADAFDRSIADYARSDGLKPKAHHSWKRIFARRELPGAEAAADNNARFVRVIAPARPIGMVIVLANGVRLEWHGDLAPDQLEALVRSASRL
jgi:hypothetical protein